MISLPPNTKVCKGCGQTKPHDQFYAHLSTRDGLRPKCIACCGGNPNKRTKHEGAAHQKIPVALPDGYVKWTAAPEDWRVAKASKQANLRRAVADLMGHDCVCRVLLLAYLTGTITLPAEVAQGDIDWVVCNRPHSTRLDIPRSLAQQCVEAGVPFFCFDEMGLLPVDGKAWAQVPEILTTV